MRDLTVAVPRAKNAIKLIMFTLLFTSCSLTSFISNGKLSDDEYSVINSLGSQENQTVYHRTSIDRDWGELLNMDFIARGGNFNTPPPNANIQDLISTELLELFKVQVNQIRSFKLEKEKLSILEPVRTFKKADYFSISKPIIIDDIAFQRVKVGNNSIRIFILKKEDGKWNPKYYFWEKSILH